MFRWKFIFRYYRIIKLKAMSELYWITVLGKIARKLFFIDKEQLELLINGLMAVNVLIHNGADLSQLYIKGNNV